MFRWLADAILSFYNDDTEGFRAVYTESEGHRVFTAHAGGDPKAGFRIFPCDEESVAAEDTPPRPSFMPQFNAGAPVWPIGRFSASNIAASFETDLEQLAEVLDINAVTIHAANVRAGWWTDLETGQPLKRNVFEMLALVHSELSEALEGHRKGLADDKLPHHPMIAVELADAVIRILDLAGAMRINLGSVIAEKARFNATRADHKPENRLKAGGKAV